MRFRCFSAYNQVAYHLNSLIGEQKTNIAVRINVRTFSNNEFLPPSTDESATHLYPLPTNQ
jgi:hypothetical protein